MPLPPIPPYLMKRVDELVAEAPPFTAEQERVLQALFAPVIRDLAAKRLSQPQAA